MSCKGRWGAGCVALLVALSGTLPVWPGLPGTAQAGPVAIGTQEVGQTGQPGWSVDATRSTLGFSVLVGDPNGGDPQPLTGQFEGWTAAISFDPGAPEDGSIWVQVDLGSIATGDPAFDQQLGRVGWFDSIAHPVATFAAEGFAPDGAGGFLAEGMLTLKGIAQPVTLAFTVEIDAQGQASARAVATVARLAHDVGSYAPEELVPPLVTVQVEIFASPSRKAVQSGCPASHKPE